MGVQLIQPAGPPPPPPKYDPRYPHPDDTTPGGNGQSLPNAIGLMQNYPNPFNPTTVIPFISDGSYIEIRVYDTVGREITTLAEGFYPRGEHQVIFNASGLPAGRYFYRLTNGGTQQVKSMTYVK